MKCKQSRRGVGAIKDQPKSSQTPSVFIVASEKDAPSETFIHSHRDQLNKVAGFAHMKDGSVWIGDTPILRQNLLLRFARSAYGLMIHGKCPYEPTVAYLAAFQRFRPQVVLAEYGPIGALVCTACRRSSIPLVVHFHGFDASRHDTIATCRRGYRTMFKYAAAVVVVSRSMRIAIESLGCPAEKIVWNPYGVDTQKFQKANPACAPPSLLAVGRLVEKKAPDLLIQAFSIALKQVPDASLQIIGDGPMMSRCSNLIDTLGVTDSVKLLGAKPHSYVQKEMQKARGFVQHSVVALDGDSEGTPNSILEASASGLPIIATRHAGIPDVVTNGVTGFIVAERDTAEMADRMVDILLDPEQAGLLGERGHCWVSDRLTQHQSLERLSAVLAAAANGGDVQSIGRRIEQELTAATSE